MVIIKISKQKTRHFSLYVFVCKAVTDHLIRASIHDGMSTRKQLFQCFGVGSECGRSSKHVKELLDENRVAGTLQTACC